MSPLLHHLNHAETLWKHNPQRVTGLRCASFVVSWLLLILACSNCWAQTVEEIDREREYNVKAANLYGLGLHTVWPAVKTSVPRNSFIIVIVGKDPFAGKLERVVNLKKTLHNMPLTVSHVEKPEQLTGSYQLIFLPADTSPAIKQKIISHYQDQPTLIVGETADFVKTGGDANLLVENGRIKLELNGKTLEQKKIQPTAQLLKIAVMIQESDRVTQKGTN